MSKYTTEIRFICESLAGYVHSSGYDAVKDTIQKAIPKIFDFDFPMFDGDYRNVLCTKIIKHYYTREIGLESFGLWKLKLDTKLNEIMPYYNKLYESETLKIEPFNNIDYTTSFNKTADQTSGQQINDSADNTSTLTDNQTSKSLSAYSDTPQGSLSGVIDNKYLTTANNITNNSNTESTTTNTNTYTRNSTNNLQTTEDYITKITGKNTSESYSKLLQEYRDSFINIDMMIINELSELFMKVW